MIHSSLGIIPIVILLLSFFCEFVIMFEVAREWTVNGMMFSRIIEFDLVTVKKSS